MLNLVLVVSVDMNKDLLLKGECVCMLSHVRPLCNVWTISLQGPLSLEFSRQEYWIKFPFSSPGSLPNPGIEPTSPLTDEFFATEVPRKFPNENKQVYPELVCVAQESATTAHLRLKHWVHLGVERISGGTTGRPSSLELVMRSWRQVDRKRGVPRDCLRERIWHHISTVNGKIENEEGVSR